MKTKAVLKVCLAGIATMTMAGCGAPKDTVHLGYVEADWIYVAAPGAGRIIEITAREGLRVEAGEVLFQLDDESERAALAQAEAGVSETSARASDLETGARAPEIRSLQARLSEAQSRFNQAQKDYERVMPLVEQGLEPRSRGDALEAQLEAAGAEVEAAQQQIAVAKLPGRAAQKEAASAATRSAEAARVSAAYRLSERSGVAPQAGRVEEIFYQTGERVGPATPILSLLPDDGLKVRFFVPQSELPAIKVGSSVSVLADGLASPASATVSFISHEAEFAPPVIYSRESRDKLVFMVEAQLPVEGGFHPGLPVEVVW